MKEPFHPVALVAQEVPESAATVELLRQLGWKAVEVATWVEAQERLSEKPFEALITDYHLAGGDGFDLIVDWRYREIYMRVLFIMEKPAERCVSVEVLGLCGVLMKPFSVEELKGALKKLLRLGFDY